MGGWTDRWMNNTGDRYVFMRVFTYIIQRLIILQSIQSPNFWMPKVHLIESRQGLASLLLASESTAGNTWNQGDVENGLEIEPPAPCPHCPPEELDATERCSVCHSSTRWQLFHHASSPFCIFACSRWDLTTQSKLAGSSWQSSCSTLPRGMTGV